MLSKERKKQTKGIDLKDILPSVANAINVLQTCIYKSANTGLFFKQFVAASVADFNNIMLLGKSNSYLKVKIMEVVMAQVVERIPGWT